MNIINLMNQVPLMSAWQTELKTGGTRQLLTGLSGSAKTLAILGTYEQLQKSEIEQYYLPADEKVVKLQRLMLDQKVRVEFFESAYKSLVAQGWNMKLFQENQRMNS